jgi:hypothetical protein
MVALAGVVYPFKPFGARKWALLTLITCFIVIGVTEPKPGRTAIIAQPWTTDVSLAGQPPASKLNEPPRVSDVKGKVWAISDRLARHTCPSPDCGVVGQHFFRESLMPLEKKGGWVRITARYDASCDQGRSGYVDSGNSSCTTANGIENGKFAEWVKASSLSEIEPADPAAGAVGFKALIGQSDDYRIYNEQFAKAAQTLLETRQCEEADLKAGFTKSINHLDNPIYFIYCGGSHLSNRIYFNAATGKISR